MDKNYMKGFGERVRARREELGMSQLDLALKVNFRTKQAISKIENGERGVKLDRVEMLADALDVSVDYLMGEEKADLISELVEELKDYPDDMIRNLLQFVRDSRRSS